MPTTWNPSDKTSGLVLSNGDLTAASPGTGVYNVRGTASWSGLKYIEVRLDALPGGGDVLVGVADTSDAIGTLPGHSFAYAASGDIYFGVSVVDTDTPLTVGDHWCLAVDTSNGRMWIRRNNGLWNKSAVADPGSNPVDYVAYGDVSISGAASPYVAVSFASGVQVTVNFGATAFAYTPPSGFSGFDTPPPPAATARAYAYVFD